MDVNFREISNFIDLRTDVLVEKLYECNFNYRKIILQPFHADDKTRKSFLLPHKTAENLTDEILTEFYRFFFSQLRFIVNRKHLPGRTKIVEISVLACTVKGGESMS